MGYVGDLHSPGTLIGETVGVGHRRRIAELAAAGMVGARPQPAAARGIRHARLPPALDTRWLALPLLPFVLAVWAAAFLHAVTLLRRRAGLAGAWMIAGVALATVLGSVLTPFGADPSGRYFLPLAFPLAFFFGSLVADLRPRIGRLAAARSVLLVVAYNLWSTLEMRSPHSARRDHPVRPGGSRSMRAATRS